jgi:hypothetical protein
MITASALVLLMIPGVGYEEIPFSRGFLTRWPRDLG